MVISYKSADYSSFGEMTEWSNVSDSKSDVPSGTGGSNPSLSALGCEFEFECECEE